MDPGPTAGSATRSFGCAAALGAAPGVDAQVIRPLTPEQWATYVGQDEPYREVCPARRPG